MNDEALERVMQLKRITAPVKKIVTVNEVKDHLCLTADFKDQDDNLQIYIDAATSMLDGASGMLNRGLITQTWTGLLDRFPRVFVLPLPPVISVDAIRYFDTAEVEQTLATSVYQVSYLGVDDHPALVELQTGQVWPSTDPRLEAVEIDFTVGYGATQRDLPGKVRNLTFMLVADMYERRETVTTESVNDNPVYTTMINNAKFWGA